MEKLFYRSGWSVSYIDFGGQGSLNQIRHCSPQHMHKEMLQSQFALNKFDEIFTVVRNPYDRFCSEYCWANKFNASYSTLEAWAKKAFKMYADNNYILDNHLRPQCEFHLPGTTVYKLEQGFEAIAQDLANRHNMQLVNEGIRELSRSSIRGFSHNKIKPSQTVKELINKHYAEDFRRFGYEVE